MSVARAALSAPIIIFFVAFLTPLFSDPTLTLVEELALLPPEIELDINQIQAFEREMEEHKNMPLPDEGEDL